MGWWAVVACHLRVVRHFRYGSETLCHGVEAPGWFLVGSFQGLCKSCKQVGGGPQRIAGRTYSSSPRTHETCIRCLRFIPGRILRHVGTGLSTSTWREAAQVVSIAASSHHGWANIGGSATAHSCHVDVLDDDGMQTT